MRLSIISTLILLILTQETPNIKVPIPRNIIQKDLLFLSGNTTVPV